MKKSGMGEKFNSKMSFWEKKVMFQMKKLNKASKSTIENISNILNQGDRILYI